MLCPVLTSTRAPLFMHACACHACQPLYAPQQHAAAAPDQHHTSSASWPTNLHTEGGKDGGVVRANLSRGAVAFTAPRVVMQARWSCQAGAALNAAVLLIGGPIAAVANAAAFSNNGQSLRSAAVAWAALGQPALTTVVSGGLLAVNLRLVHFAGLGYII